MIFPTNEFKKRLQRRRQSEDAEKRKKLEEEEKKNLMLLAGIQAAQTLANIAQMMRMSMDNIRMMQKQRGMQRYARSATAEHDAIEASLAKARQARPETLSAASQAALTAPILNASRLLQRRSQSVVRTPARSMSR